MKAKRRRKDQLTKAQAKYMAELLKPMPPLTRDTRFGKALIEAQQIVEISSFYPMDDEFQPFLQAFEDGRRMPDARRKGGKTPKYAKAIMAETERILRRAPNLKGMDVFNLFPEENHSLWVTLDDGDYEVYREADTLTQKDPRRGKLHNVGLSTFFDNYLPKARLRTK